MVFSQLVRSNFSIIMEGDFHGFRFKLKEIILKNLSNENLSVPWLAAQMDISERQFHRLVKKHTGKTVNQFVKNVRLEYAKILLEKGIYSTKEVAFAIGYQKSSWFSTQFFLKFGVRPKDI